jgi:hypothetical protein
MPLPGGIMGLLGALPVSDGLGRAFAELVPNAVQCLRRGKWHTYALSPSINKLASLLSSGDECDFRTA